MAGRRHDVQAESVDVDRLGVGEWVGVDAELGVGGSRGRAGAVGDQLHRLGVVEVAVREQHQADVAGGLEHAVDVGSVRRTRIDHHRS